MKKYLKFMASSVLIMSLSGSMSLAADADEIYSVGDIDRSGVTDMSDMSLLSLHLMGDKKLDDNILYLADCNGDQKVDIADLAHFKQFICHEDVIMGKQPDITGSAGTDIAVNEMCQLIFNNNPEYA